MSYPLYVVCSTGKLAATQNKKKEEETQQKFFSLKQVHVHPNWQAFTRGKRMKERLDLIYTCEICDHLTIKVKSLTD